MKKPTMLPPLKAQTQIYLDWISPSRMQPSPAQLSFVCLCVYIYIYIYMIIKNEIYDRL